MRRLCYESQTPCCWKMLNMSLTVFFWVCSFWSNLFQLSSLAPQNENSLLSSTCLVWPWSEFWMCIQQCECFTTKLTVKNHNLRPTWCLHWTQFAMFTLRDLLISCAMHGTSLRMWPERLVRTVPRNGWRNSSFQKHLPGLVNLQKTMEHHHAIHG